jgi:hypothetical protein
MAAGGLSYFSLMKSNQKSSQQKGFFAARGLYPAKRTEPGLELLPLPSTPHACKNFLCPAAALPHIVLPVFARSCSADTLGKTTALRFPYFCFLQIVISIEPGRKCAKARKRDLMQQVSCCIFSSKNRGLLHPSLRFENNPPPSTPVIARYEAIPN